MLLAWLFANYERAPATSRRPVIMTSFAAAAIFAASQFASGQELRAVGQVRSGGPATSEASEKIVSSLRALIADARQLGLTRQNAFALDAAGRFSSATLKVDQSGSVQVYVSVAAVSEGALSMLRQHDL